MQKIMDMIQLKEYSNNKKQFFNDLKTFLVKKNNKIVVSDVYQTPIKTSFKLNFEGKHITG